jgi:hypothetical protein
LSVLNGGFFALYLIDLFKHPKLKMVVIMVKIEVSWESSQWAEVLVEFVFEHYPVSRIVLKMIAAQITSMIADSDKGFNLNLFSLIING